MRHVLFDAQGYICGELVCEPSDLSLNTPDGCTAYPTDEILSDVMLVNGEITAIPEAILSQLNSQQLNQDVRSVRNERLAQSDWTQVADAPVDQAAWAAYRQALRDIPQQEGFPENVVWPDQP